MSRFMFNGRYCSDFGIAISGEGVFDAPELDVTAQSIPGRNGDLIFSNNRYKNVTVTYPALIHEDFTNNARAARAWLLTPKTYCRLQDEYHPDEYRMALFAGPINFGMNYLNKSGTCSLTFNCKPQRYLVEGESQYTAMNGGSIRNITEFDALPLIEVTGTGPGTLTIGDRTVQFLSLTRATVDCELQDVYSGSTNLNSTVSVPAFPVLRPGNNSISWTGGINTVKITPRWWTL